SADRADHEALPPLARATDRESPSLSFAQERLWFIQQLDPQSTTYNIARAVLLRGALDVGALERSFAGLIRRHETLRTAIGLEEGRPVPSVDAGSAFALRIESLPDGMDRASWVRAHVETETATPFDLTRAPLMRATLLGLRSDEHLLIVGVHHVVADAWSLGILSRELGSLYRAEVEGATSPLPELPVQYSDFAAWQRGWLQGEALAREI